MHNSITQANDCQKCLKRSINLIAYLHTNYIETNDYSLVLTVNQFIFIMSGMEMYAMCCTCGRT
jgi:hypothetical protein